MRFSIRSNVFETNSSSVHALVISPETKRIYPNTITFGPGEFGRYEDYFDSTDDRASYIWTGISEMYYDGDKKQEYISKWQERLTDFCLSRSVTPEFINLQELDDNTYAYVDHAEDLGQLLDLLYEDDNMLDAYLFGEGSCVCTGSDESDYNYDYEYGEDIVDGLLRYHNVELKEGSYVYEKGN